MFAKSGNRDRPERGWAAFIAVSLAVLLMPTISNATSLRWPPRGYSTWNGQIAFRWLSNGHCVNYADHGCWRTLFMARRGCPGGLFVTLNEFRGKTLIGDTLDARDVVPPLTPVRLEFDADFAGDLRGVLASVDCYRL